MPARNPAESASRPADTRVSRVDWPTLACCAILAAGAIVVYGRTYSDPPVFDDVPTIINNPTIRHLGTALSPPVNTTAAGRPIVNLSLAINFAISGTGVWSYHALNLAVHILAGFTLFGIARRLLALSGAAEALSIAFCAALIWTLHALQTESVTYIVQRAESLMGLFYLQTVYWFVRWQQPAPPHRGAGAAGNGEGGQSAGASTRAGISCAALSIAFCCLGMATKEVMVSAPVGVLLLDRLYFAGSFGRAWRLRKFYYVGLAATWIPLIALVWRTGIMADLVSHNGNRSEISGVGPGASAWQYWATQPEAIVRYLKLAVWPHPLVLDYGTQWLSTPGHPASAGELMSRLLGPGAVVAVLAGATLYALIRNSPFGLLGFCFFAILAPTSVIPGDRQTAADHRMYLALIPVVLVFVLGAYRRLGRAAVPSCLVLAAALGFLSFERNQDYSSEERIWGDTVAKRPDNYFARANLGTVLLNEPGRLDDAIAQYEEAVRLKPDLYGARIDLGNALSNVPGRLDDAIAQYEEALRLKPDLYGARIGLGNALSTMPGRLDDAIAQYEGALRLRPDNAAGHFNLGNALSRAPGRLDDTIAQYREALSLKPDYAKAHFSLAVALLRLGHADEAREHLEAGLRLQPDDAQARRILADIGTSRK
jgi:Flp pilus assembly protein TadD